VPMQAPHELDAVRHSCARAAATRRSRRGVKFVAVSVAVLALQSAVVVVQGAESPEVSAAELLAQFDSEPAFWRQAEIAQRIVALGDSRILARLEHRLSDEDRHVRGNAALIFAGLGDGRGFSVISAMLTDASDRPEGQGIPVIIGMVGSDGRLLRAEQIKADRYYAVHLLGKLKDPRALPVLIPLLSDESINYKVAWALGEIGGPAAIDALITALNDKSPDVRVIAIHSLEQLGAGKALPVLHSLRTDWERCHFGVQQPVRDAAGDAIRKLEPR
jgi:HEAT repeat protein